MTTFNRADWTLFRSLSTIGQKAGVGLHLLRRLVCKELTDNALDACGEGVSIERRGSLYIIQDQGPGIPGTPEDIASLFSIGRVLSSSKLRVPSRGALGNGLRVVSGAVLASGGSLTIETRGMRLELDLRDDGTTLVKRHLPSERAPSERAQGTRIEMTLGDSIPADRGELGWAKAAIAFRGNIAYKDGPSSYWYCSDSFFELLRSAGDSTPVVDVVKRFAKVTRKVLRELGDLGTCGEVTREFSESLLGKLRALTTPVKASQLVTRELVGNARVFGEFSIAPGRGKFNALLPFSVEILASKADDDSIHTFVNGTPITEEIHVWRGKPTEFLVHGCGLNHSFPGVCKAPVQLVLNVTIPYMPIKSDGKEPDFSRMHSEIHKAIQKATRAFKTELKRSVSSQSDIILGGLDAAVDKVSGDGAHRFSLRQLYYAIRPIVLARHDELDYNYFGKVITDYESTHGEIRGMYRDPRGVLYHPHTGELIPIGTLAVEGYKRPAWTFKRILYCEKEGLFTVLRDSKWPERHDCALLSSKGFASRAVRDVLDLLGDDSEEIQVFCIHDGDASGTLIYQALQEGTRARPGRRVEVINLGLEPWEAVKMGLQVETFTVKRNRKLPVARYVRTRDAEKGSTWEKWLQGKRVELNAMTSPEFVTWLDSKMSKYGTEKIIPPRRVLEKHLRRATERQIRVALTRDILASADLEGQVEAKMGSLDFKVDSSRLSTELDQNPEKLWSEVVDDMAIVTLAGGSAPTEIPKDPLWQEIAELLRSSADVTILKGVDHPARTAIQIYTSAFGLGDFISRIKLHNLVRPAVFSILASFQPNEKGEARVEVVRLGLSSRRTDVRSAALDVALAWEDPTLLPLIQEHTEVSADLERYRQSVVSSLELDQEEQEQASA